MTGDHVSKHTELSTDSKPLSYPFRLLVEKREARLTPPARRPSAEEEAPSAILVFRDGRRSEVQNFAIVGQTIWVFPAQRARKVPVSDLDVEATRKANADRSVEF